MSLPTENKGLGSITGVFDTESIFTQPVPDGANNSVTMASATQSLKIGQVVSLVSASAATQEYAKLANKAAVQAETKVMGVLIEDIEQAASEIKAIIAVKGTFKQSKLTPNDIPVGVYANGNIIIE